MKGAPLVALAIVGALSGARPGAAHVRAAVSVLSDQGRRLGEPRRPCHGVREPRGPGRRRHEPHPRHLCLERGFRRPGAGVGRRRWRRMEQQLVGASAERRRALRGVRVRAVTPGRAVHDGVPARPAARHDPGPRGGRRRPGARRVCGTRGDQRGRAMGGVRVPRPGPRRRQRRQRLAERRLRRRHADRRHRPRQRRLGRQAIVGRQERCAEHRRDRAARRVHVDGLPGWLVGRGVGVG
jgi:hypothetical protein